MMLRAIAVVILTCGFSLAGESPTSKPVVVELFTSEGCSSCPPAEQQLAVAAKQPPVAGVILIPLAWHVDYFNDPWIDPFSSRQWTARQNEYGQRFGLPSIYTPQMVVDGTREFVGGEKKPFNEAISVAASSIKGDVQVSTSPGDDGKSVRAQIRASGLPKLTDGDTAEVFVIVTEDGFRIPIKRGENGGSTLRHDGVVRFARQIGQIDPRSADRFNADTTITLDPAWKRENVRAVVFVQRDRTLQILGAGAVSMR